MEDKMGWHARVETNRDEIYRVILPSGSTGGKALLSFITIANAGCSNKDFRARADVDVCAWIRNFNERSSLNFCDLVVKLYSAIYAGTTTLGNWEYEEDEFEFFLHRNPGYPISQIEFKQTIQTMREMWMDIRDVMSVVRTLLDEFKKGYLDQTDWYVENDTIPEFASLFNTLELAEKRGSDRVRIRID